LLVSSSKKRGTSQHERKAHSKENHKRRGGIQRALLWVLKNIISIYGGLFLKK
jgi:hypothetical protein